MLMLLPVRLHESKDILKTGLMKKYLKNLGQETNSLHHSKNQGCISIKNYIKKAKYDAKKLIATKKQALFDEKLTESFDILKKLWNTLKYLGMSKKTVVSNSNAVINNKSLTYDAKLMSKVLEDFFSHLA